MNRLLLTGCLAAWGVLTAGAQSETSASCCGEKAAAHCEKPSGQCCGKGGACAEMANPVVSTIMNRRSVRKYQARPVEHEKLALLATCAINAPSAVNRQPWLVRVVEDAKLISDVSDVYRKANAEQVARDPDFRNMFRNAPNIICVCTPAKGGGELDAGLLGENVMLAAHSLGLGTCCLGGPVRFLKESPEAKFFMDRLNIPADYQLCYIIAVGYPDEQPEARPRDASKIEFIK